MPGTVLACGRPVPSSRPAPEAGVEVLTLFAFSSENWRRPAEEVNSLMRLFVEVLQREVDELHENGIQLRFIGDREHLPEILRKRMAEAEARTAGNSAHDAGAGHGVWRSLGHRAGGAPDCRQGPRGDLSPRRSTKALLGRHMSLAGLPSPDLLIRTGGEQRISNFLLWDLAYTEIFFTDSLWPDFGAADIATALAFFRGRQRRFGRTGDQLEAIAD